MCDFVFSLQEFLKLVPGIAIFPLSFYLAWKKIGTSVSCSMSYSSSRISANQITNIVLANEKDKPITIFEIQAVMDNDISFSVDKFDPPIVLKSLETITISAKPYSELYIGDQQWEPDALSFGFGKIDLYLSTPGKIIKCRNISHPDSNKLNKLSHFRQASKFTNKFNGVVYSSSKAAYAITYKSSSTTKTAIIDSSGFISGDWDYIYNFVERDLMRSTEGIKEFLKISKADVVFQVYGVDRLE
jgi:hypothetical protein